MKKKFECKDDIVTCDDLIGVFVMNIDGKTGLFVCKYKIECKNYNESECVLMSEIKDERKERKE